MIIHTYMNRERERGIQVGSWWECALPWREGNKIGMPHTVPMKVAGKCGSVRVRLVPAPRGTSIVGSPVVALGYTSPGCASSDLWSRAHCLGCARSAEAEVHDRTSVITLLMLVVALKYGPGYICSGREEDARVRGCG